MIRLFLAGGAVVSCTIVIYLFKKIVNSSYTQAQKTQKVKKNKRKKQVFFDYIIFILSIVNYVFS
jgi:hypothetical protein